MASNSQEYGVKCHDCSEIKKSVDKLEKNQAELKVNIAELKEQLAQLPSLKEDIVKEVRAMMGEVLKHVNAAQAVQPPLPVKSASKQDIVMIGGETTKGASSSVEIFSWEKGAWVQLPPMKELRSAASSFVYENHVIVSGGFTALDYTDSMEMLKTEQEPLQWITFPAKLPAKLSSHTTVVYENRLIVIGGYNATERSHSNVIYEVHLIPPYSTKKALRRIPQPLRRDHGTELVNNKIFILGGRTSYGSKDAIDSVIVYDVVKNECKEIRSLPYAVWGMATVTWRNKVILIGGVDTNEQALNDVIMYDIESGESGSLPPMKYKRWSCSAVVTEDDMVVMGGWNKDQKYLNSVECFSFSSNSWKELPAMMKARQLATAVVKPIK